MTDQEIAAAIGTRAPHWRHFIDAPTATVALAIAPPVFRFVTWPVTVPPPELQARVVVGQVPSAPEHVRALP